MPDLPRVVVTGLGVVSPLGCRPAFWRRLTAGESGVAPTTRVEPRGGAPRLAAELREWDPRASIGPAAIRRMDRLSQMFVTASRMALADAGLAPAGEQAESTAIVLGTALGDIAETETFVRGLVAKGPGRANPLTFPNLVLNAPSGYVAIELGLRGPSYTVCRGEASGEAALALAYDTIAAGTAPIVLAGGGDEISPVLYEIQKDLGVLSPLARRAPRDMRAPEGARPFARTRNGFVMGEGAAMFVLERAEDARARGAPIYAELTGHASTAFAATPHGWPTPEPDASRRHAAELRTVGWQPRVDRAAGSTDLFVSAANGSPDLDAFALAHLASVAGDDRACGAVVTSVKGAVGEFGGAGALAVAAAVLALRTGETPRLGGGDALDAAAPLRFATADEPDPPGGFRHALVAATPRGGACTTLVFRAGERAEGRP